MNAGSGGRKCKAETVLSYIQGGTYEASQEIDQGTIRSYEVYSKDRQEFQASQI